MGILDSPPQTSSGGSHGLVRNFIEQLSPLIAQGPFANGANAPILYLDALEQPAAGFPQLASLNWLPAETRARAELLVSPIVYFDLVRRATVGTKGASLGTLSSAISIKSVSISSVLDSSVPSSSVPSSNAIPIS